MPARVVEREILDDLLPDDPRAVRSRRDLRRVNRWMGHASILTRVIRSRRSVPRTICELGAGDGTLLLRVARRLGPSTHPVRAVLVDRHPAVSSRTEADFRRIGWDVDIVPADVIEWLPASGADFDVILANLFLHHLTDAELRRLLLAVSTRTRRFVACDPRRDAFASAGAALLWMIGCSDVSTHDGRLSVRAGFRGRELSDLWPPEGGWKLSEWRAGPFSHGFSAIRHGEL